ncbi:hypothetical protein K435DRAFT_800309 [Dendrothele bispora CBS 962.96]|uniref:Uncharacterized protein n=1 Tax=Dendrothele bispora (strain CBS 962.96) TaxID=1314807 RepID=A0A4V4HEX5_DENBC|nr:hypothetical protein K435DRAFT_800309 [Dendrothele bispora CBS 962.96]
MQLEKRLVAEAPTLLALISVFKLDIHCRSRMISIVVKRENSRKFYLRQSSNYKLRAILKALDEADSSDDIDYYLLHKDQPFHYDEDNNDELRELEAEVVTEEDMDSELSNLMQICQTIFHP